MPPLPVPKPKLIVRVHRLRRRLMANAAERVRAASERGVRAVPRVLLLADQPGWAFDFAARDMDGCLSGEFRFAIRYTRDRPTILAGNYDLVFLFFWGESEFQRYGFPTERVIKQVSSHRWEDDPLWGPCTPAELASRYLQDAGTVACTSLRLAEALKDRHPGVIHLPRGYNSDRFRCIRRRSGPMAVGWAGCARDPVKGLNDIMRPACEGKCNLQIAPGGVRHERMNAFYNGLDVFLVASRHEGQLLPLMEAMAAGCFPVCTDVGIVPELVRDGDNGLILRERSPEAFAAALDWCGAHLDAVRSAGQRNAEEMRGSRSWEQMGAGFARTFRSVLAR